LTVADVPGNDDAPGEAQSGTEAATEAATDAPVPKLPRGRGFTLSPQQLMRIGMTVVLLIAVVALQEPCSNSVSAFVTTFGGRPEAAKGTNATTSLERGETRPEPATTRAVIGDDGTATTVGVPATPAAQRAAGSQGSASSAPPVVYERISPSMTDSELRAAIERARRRAAAAEAAAAGSAVAPLPATTTTTPTTTPPSPATAPPSPPPGGP
jgi:hypothetical protein